MKRAILIGFEGHFTSPSIRNHCATQFMSHFNLVTHACTRCMHAHSITTRTWMRAWQVLVVTHSMCWGLALQSHLVVLMDTLYYDGAEHRYTDYPITDILQMMGRACRPLDALTP